jgi:hypothetical protein
MRLNQNELPCSPGSVAEDRKVAVQPARAIDARPDRQSRDVLETLDIPNPPGQCRRGRHDRQD